MAERTKRLAQGRRVLAVSGSERAKPLQKNTIEAILLTFGSLNLRGYFRIRI